VPPSVVGAALPLVCALVVLDLGWRSAGWPLIHDAPLMHYVAWLIGSGAAPYRDVFDMNAPGAYLVHLGVLRVLGAGDIGWRLFDLGWLGLTCAVVVLFTRPFGAVAAAVSSLSFAAYHLAGGAWLSGQRDFLLCLFLVTGALLVVSGGGAARLAAAGLTGGAAAALKPPAVIFLLLLALFGARSHGRPRWRGAAVVLVGGAVMPLMCAAWLAWTGGLAAFVRASVDYVIPLYSRLARVSPWTTVERIPFGWPLWALLGALIVLGALAGVREVHRLVVLAGVGYGVVHLALQAKGWEYQLYPLALFACLAAGLAVAAGRALARWGAVAAVALLSLTLWAKGVQESAAAWVTDKAARVTRITDDLRAQFAPGDLIQVLDTAEGGVHALFRLGARQPTRFIYDFHFFHDETNATILALRAEFVGALARHPPKFVLMLRKGWPSGEYERFDGFPEFAHWLAAGYELARDAGDYRVYVKRP
jgi:hypothetical protein